MIVSTKGHPTHAKKCKSTQEAVLFFSVKYFDLLKIKPINKYH